MSRKLILHCLGWKLKDVINNLDRIKECGYHSVQINPIQP